MRTQKSEYRSQNDFQNYRTFPFWILTSVSYWHVNVVSACDTEETEQNIAFVAAQKALIGLTKSLAKTLPKNFRVNAVAVSEKSGQTENLDAELFRPKSGVSEDDVARTILYLLSSESIVLNGQILKAE